METSTAQNANASIKFEPASLQVTSKTVEAYSGGSSNILRTIATMQRSGLIVVLVTTRPHKINEIKTY